MSRNLTVGEIAGALHCNERSTRKHLKEVVPTIDLYANDPEEIVPRTALIELCLHRKDTLVGRRLIRLLGRTGDLHSSSEPPRYGPPQ
jgi:hypothetical protein